MPGYQYLDNTPRMEGIQSIGQTMGGLAGALPQLQLQAQMFRQKLALQRAQELLNQQRMVESQARAKMYEKEQGLKEAQQLESGERMKEITARTQHSQGQEERERNIATAAMMMGAAMSQRYAGQHNVDTNDPTAQAIQAAGLLSARDPALMGRFMQTLEPQVRNVPPGNVALQGGQPIYTNVQPTSAEGRPMVVSPGAAVFQGGQPVYTNTTQRAATQGGLSPAAQAILQRMGGGSQAQPAAAGAPAVGTVSKGYRFKGGDPAVKDNWEKVQ